MTLAAFNPYPTMIMADPQIYGTWSPMEQGPATYKSPCYQDRLSWGACDAAGAEPSVGYAHQTSGTSCFVVDSLW